jgi:hypothetical protein
LIILRKFLVFHSSYLTSGAAYVPPNGKVSDGPI